MRIVSCKDVQLIRIISCDRHNLHYFMIVYPKLLSFPSSLFNVKLHGSRREIMEDWDEESARGCVLFSFFSILPRTNYFSSIGQNSKLYCEQQNWNRSSNSLLFSLFSINKSFLD